MPWKFVLLLRLRLVGAFSSAVVEPEEVVYEMVGAALPVLFGRQLS